MKIVNSLPIRKFTSAAVSGLAVALVSCESMNEPLSDSGGSNPLDPPGRNQASSESASYTQSYPPGTFLQTTSSQTMFYSKFPRSNDQPTKMLSDATDVKVVSSKGSYTKVEVIDTGEVGYVPSMMLGEKRSPNEVAVTPGMGEVPVTPGMAPEPEDLSEVPVEPEVPSLVPPENIDPSLPAE